MVESIARLTIAAVVCFPMLIIGILMYGGKAGFLLAGYNTMSREEKAKWDEKRLLRFSGKCIIVLSILPIGMELLILAGLPFGLGATVPGAIACAVALVCVSLVTYKTQPSGFLEVSKSKK